MARIPVGVTTQLQVSGTIDDRSLETEEHPQEEENEDVKSFQPTTIVRLFENSYTEGMISIVNNDAHRFNSNSEYVI